MTWLPNEQLCIAHQQVYPVFLAAGFSDRRVILSRCRLLPAPPRIWQRKLIHFLPAGWIHTALSTAIHFALDQECILRSTSRAFSLPPDRHNFLYILIRRRCQITEMNDMAFLSLRVTCEGYIKSVCDYQTPLLRILTLLREKVESIRKAQRFMNSGHSEGHTCILP